MTLSVGCRFLRRRPPGSIGQDGSAARVGDIRHGSCFYLTAHILNNGGCMKCISQGQKSLRALSVLT